MNRVHADTRTDITDDASNNTLIVGSERSFAASPNDHRKRLDEIKRISDPLCFEHDGIKVRVLFEGTADLNELVKVLFMTG